jgi:uncharacterized membrane protein YfcA
VTPLEFVLAAFGVAALAGLLGSLLGLGGGIIVIPALTLLLHVDIRLAIGASIIAVIATSSGAAAAYVRDGFTNLRVAMLLEIGTTIGALTGAHLAGIVSGRALYAVFGVVMGYSALMMLRRRAVETSESAAAPQQWADRLRLHGSYHDARGGVVAYRVRHAPLGLALMYVAGVVSGLLGIGSGALKVPAMDLAMGLPIKVSTATSNFMIGVTAAASAGVYFMRGDIDPFIAAPVAIGVLLGATVGARVLPRIENVTLRLVFVAVLLWVSVQMVLKAVGG